MINKLTRWLDHHIEKTDPNPFTWKAIKDNNPLRVKLLKCFKYHLKDSRTPIHLRLLKIINAFLPLFERRFVFCLEVNDPWTCTWASFDWSTFKFSYNKTSDFYERDSEGCLINKGAYTITWYYERFPWQKGWKQVKVKSDEWDHVDYFDQEFDDYQERQLMAHVTTTPQEYNELYRKTFINE